MNHEFDIAGPSGTLQAQMTEAPTPAPVRTIAILCHPHPQYGGSMHDGVLESAARVLTSHGIDALRFNFRGVGRSSGTYGEGVGEVEDLLAVGEWTRQTYPDAQLWLAGYSFGAHIVHRGAPQLNPAAIMLIAPATGMMNFAPSPLDATTRAIAGDQDNFVNTAQLSAWLGERAQILPSVDHFFSTGRAGLEAALADWVTQTITAPVSHS